MLRFSLSRTIAGSAALALLLFVPLSAQGGYRAPPQPIPRILDAPPFPIGTTGPRGEWLLLQNRASMPPIAEVARPMLRIAGMRIDPATNGRADTRFTLTGFTLVRLSDGSRQSVTIGDGTPGFASWSPDGARFAFPMTRDDGVDEWVVDVATGKGRAVAHDINAAAGGCDWMPDGATLVCLMVPADRGAPPPEPKVPAGPVVQETKGRVAPVRTYEDLLEDPHDEALFDYYMTSRVALVDAVGGQVKPVGSPAVFLGASPSPNGDYLLVRRVHRPYSYLVPVYDFPVAYEVWNRGGDLVRQIADLPIADDVPIRGVRTGPRSLEWRPLRPASLVWAEALDGGDPGREVEHRDRVLQLDGPFISEPHELARTGERYAGIEWGNGVALLTDYDRSRQWLRTWVFDPDRPRAERRLLWDRSREDAYGDPGRPQLVATPTGERVLLQDGSAIYLAGDGASPEGDRPFLDRLDLETFRSERLWQSGADMYEQVVDVLDPDGDHVLTRRESTAEPPNYHVLDVPAGGDLALTDFQDPAPELRGITKQLVTYERDDGVPLSGTLYLPADYTAGERLPVVLWAYPREFVSAAAAGQVRSSENRFTTFGGPTHLFFLTQGYAVFDGPSMPIIGGDTANDTYVQQLVASARAAVDKLVEMGVGDRDRMGIGGHSYGAFMTANLLAHSDLFRAGIARSGAYNRTLTPFGFQNERRTYWEAPDIYYEMSPFMHAQDIDEPLLMIHGIADNNSGTFPIQSERMFHAINGLGGTARLVMLPAESHGYSARESIMDTLAEMIAWFDEYVKNAQPRAAGTR